MGMNRLNRRGFLKRIGQIIGGISVVPSVVKSKEPGFTKDMVDALNHKGVGPFKPIDALNPNIEGIYDDDLDFMRQDAIRSNEEYEAIIRAINLKFVNPEHEKIPGARAWLEHCEDLLK